jgi:outer membrane protein assembly factor BamB
MKRHHLLWPLLIVVIAGCGRRSNPSDASLAAAERAAGESNVASRLRPADDEIAAGDWPFWRGPHGDGRSRETGWNPQWPADGPAKLWTASVGIGFSSISIADGRAFSMGHRDGQDTVWCFDSETGDLLWKYTYACKLVDNLHDGGPACTPTIHGDRVFTLSKEGHLFCFRAKDGHVVWKTHLQELLDVSMPEWGFSCSPLVLGEKLLLEAGRTCAFNKETGELIWKTKDYRSGYGSPALFEPAGSEPLVAVLNNDYLMAADLATGKEVDKLKWETNFATSACTPTAKGDTLFVSTGYGKGCLLAALVNGKLEKVYGHRKLRAHMANPVLVEKSLYGIDGQSHQSSRCALVCMDLASGKVHWQELGFGCGTVIAAGDTLIILSDDGELATANATTQGYQQVSRAKVLDGTCWTPPVLAWGRIYCRNSAGDLVCLDVRK